MTEKDFEIKQAILDTKIELQEQYQKNTQDLMSHYQKQEQLRIDNEKELRLEYKAELAKLQDELSKSQEHHKKEITLLEEKLTEATTPSKTPKARTSKKKEEN